MPWPVGGGRHTGSTTEQGGSANTSAHFHKKASKPERTSMSNSPELRIQSSITRTGIFSDNGPAEKERAASSTLSSVCSRFSVSPDWI